MQYKQIINPSFTVLMLEVQEYLKQGWTIDESNYPVAHFVYYEVHLVRDESEAVKEVFDSPDSVLATVVKKPAGRPAKAKQ